MNLAGSQGAGCSNSAGGRLSVAFVVGTTCGGNVAQAILVELYKPFVTVAQSFQHSLLSWKQSERLSVASYCNPVALHLNWPYWSCAFGTAFSAIIQALGLQFNRLHLVFLKSWLHLLRLKLSEMWLLKSLKAIMTNLRSFASGNSTCVKFLVRSLRPSADHHERSRAINSGTCSQLYLLYFAGCANDQSKAVSSIAQAFSSIVGRVAPMRNNLANYLQVWVMQSRLRWVNHSILREWQCG